MELMTTGRGAIAASMSQRLKLARVFAGYRTASDALRRFGWKGSTYRAHENGQNNYDAEIARIYGLAYGVGAAWLLTGEGEMHRPAGMTAGTGAFRVNEAFSPRESSPSPVPIAGKVAAGVWLESFSVGSSGNDAARSPFPPDPLYSLEAQFDLLVEGESANKFARDGDYVRCVDVGRAGIELRDGDLVVVERLRDMKLKETSIKRLRKNGNHMDYWPESDDPQWQAPIADAECSGEGMKVVALVLWQYRKSGR